MLASGLERAVATASGSRAWPDSVLRSLWRDVAYGSRGWKAPLGALPDADQHAVVEERRVSARDARRGARKVRNDERQPGLFRGSKVTPPTGFAVMSQTGREPG